MIVNSYFAVSSTYPKMKLYSLTAILFLAIASCDGQNLTCYQAKDSIGKHVTVCGEVIGTHYAATSKGQPTFINLCEAYPHAPITIVVWNDVKVSYDISTLKGKTICVTGWIKDYKGKAEIEVSNQTQIVIR